MNMRRCLSFVLLLCVCFSVLFSHSHTAYALSYNNYTYNVFYKDVSLGDTNNSLIDDGSYHFGNHNDIHVIDFLYQIKLPEPIPKGTVFDFEIAVGKSAGTMEILSINGGNSNYDYLGFEYSSSNVRNAGDESALIKFLDITASGGPISYIYLNVRYTESSSVAVQNIRTSITSLSITEVSQNGLLGSIIEMIKKIWNGIVNLPSNIANSIKGFFDNIVNAVVNLGNFIIDGIKNLFIPTEEDITNMKDKWDTLLSDRFGALYQVGALISDYATAFTEQSKGTITFPSVTIPLAGSEFSFGGWEVQVVPDGFGVVFDTLKLITSILATLLFANGLKKRFDKLLGGADDI